MSDDKRPIAIIGAGLTGCFLATLLAKRGLTVIVYEKASREDVLARSSKRSFNLTFRRYARRALGEAGLWEKVEPHTLSLKGFMTEIKKSSKPICTSLDETKDPCYTIGRATLLEIILNEAMSYPNVSFQFGTALAGIDYAQKVICIQHEGSKKIEQVPVQAVLGTDGVHSATRTAMLHGLDAEHSEEYADWSYKQILIPKELAQKLGLEKNISYAWTRTDAVLPSHPDRNGSHVAMLALPKDGEKGFAALTTPDAIKSFIEKEFPTLLPALPVISEALLHNPEGSFVTVRTSHWHREGFSAILGDAAHAFYPFYGQGVSAGFGDALELANLVDAYHCDWNSILPLYEKNRKVHMDTLAQLSKKEFDLYKRSSRADYGVIYDRFEGLLHAMLPTLVCPPLEDMITQDPGKAADYVVMRKKLRTATTYFGAPVLVGFVTAIVALFETIDRLFKKPRQDNDQRLPVTSQVANIQASIHHQLDPDLIHEWEQLWNSSENAHPFNSYAWFAACRTAFDIREFAVVTVYENNALHAILPLTIEKKYGLRFYRSPGSHFLDKSSLLTKDSNEEVLKTLFSQLTLLGNVYIAELEERFALPLASDQPAASLISSSASLYVSLTQDPYQLMSKKHRAMLKNRAAAFGDRLRFQLHAGSIASELPAMIDIENNSFKPKERTDLFYEKAAQDLYRELMSAPAANCVVGLLYLDSKPIAHSFGMVSHDTFYATHLAYRSELRSLMPGKLVAGQLLSALYERGIAKADLSRGKSSFKSQFANNEYSQFDLYISKNIFVLRYVRSIHWICGKIEKLPPRLVGMLRYWIRHLHTVWNPA